MFAGVAQVGENFGAFELRENLYAGGVGLRFVVEQKNGVTLRVDYGVGKDGGRVVRQRWRGILMNVRAMQSAYCIALTPLVAQPRSCAA